MANPHHRHRRRDEADEAEMHDDSGTQHQSWTRRNEGDRSPTDQHGRHPADERHSNRYGNAADRDRERRARKHEDRGEHGTHRSERGTHGGDRRTRGQEPNHDETGHGHANRWGSNRTHDAGTSRGQRTEERRGRTEDRRGRRHSGDTGRHGRPNDESGRHHDRGGEQEDRRYGGRREERGRSASSQGSPHSGSQRGSHREEDISGHVTGQRGESTHHSDPSDSRFREETTGQREHRHGGERGTSERDRRFGSRRGHGSERHTEDRHSSR